jgi:cyclin-dependent kinase 10
LDQLTQRLHSKDIYFSHTDIKTIVLQLLKALIALHDQGIVHRDLKMSNLLITQDGQLKLADFGLARQLPSL